MTKIELDLGPKELEMLIRLQKKYGYEKGQDLIKFLLTIFDQHYVEFLWGVNKIEKRDEFGIYNQQ
jgi:hypothetical protein